MSSFTCEHCGAEILDTEKGYITGCEHYPLMEEAVSNKNKTEILELLDGIDRLARDSRGCYENARGTDYACYQATKKIRRLLEEVKP